MAGGPGRAHISHPIAGVGRPGVGRPGGPTWGGARPGYGWGNAGYRPGYGWGAAAVGAGLAYGAASAYGSGYYGGGYYEEPSYSYQEPSYSYQVSGGGSDDAIAECARRFKTYDPATQTYIRSKGVRAHCP